MKATMWKGAFLAMLAGVAVGCTTYEQVPPRVEARPAPPPTSGTSSAGAGADRATVKTESRSPKAALSSDWTGTYSYTDKGPNIGGLNTFVGYSLVVRPDRTARYEANGYQTDTVVDCDVVENGNSLVIVVREMKPNGFEEPSVPSYPKGVRLLILTRAKGQVATIWQEAKPAFDGCASGYVCFKREK